MTRCKGITFNGTRCTREAVTGSVYCWQHKKNNKSPAKKASPKKSPRKQSPGRKLTKDEEHIQLKYCACLTKVGQKQPNINKYAICTASTGRITNSCKQYE